MILCIVLFFFRCFNLVSLDATLVALVWQEAIARAGNVELLWYDRGILGISVWIIYIADHLLDGLTNGVRVRIWINQAPRHRFIAKHRSLFIFLVGIFLFVDANLALKLTEPLLLAGIFLSVIAFVYLAINAWLLSNNKWFRGREIIIALIFSLGSGLVPLMQSQRPELIIRSLFFFALLCAINTTLVARLEQGVNGKLLLAPFNNKKTRYMAAATALLLAVGYFYHILPITKALLISLLGLLLIPSVAKKWGYESASLAADGALLIGGLLSLLS